MVNNEQSKEYLGYKYHLNMMMSCVKLCIGTTFEEVDYLQFQMIRAICRVGIKKKVLTQEKIR